MAQKKLLILMRSSPYSSSTTLEGLEASLLACTFSFELRIIFSDNGVWQLLKEQQADVIQQKNFAKMLQAFADFDLHTVFVDYASMQQRNLMESDFVIPVTLLQAKAFSQLLHQQDLILNF